jgi:aminopeptidase YwaD
MDVNQQAWQHLQRLCVDIGPRPLGSQANHTAARYVEGVFRSAGLQVELQDFPCLEWSCSDTQLQVGERSLQAAANWFSSPCDVAAPAVAIATLAELRSADLQDRIAILCGDLTREALSPRRNRAYNPERHGQILDLLESKGPLALITVNPKVRGLDSLILDEDLDIPSATVSAETGLAMVPPDGRTVHLRIDSRRAPGRYANVVGRQASRDAESIVLCAHFDTWPGAPGAVDNGSGTAMLLTLAELLTREALPVGLELVAFNGEEGSSAGDEAYLAQHGLEPVTFGRGVPQLRRSPELAHVLTVINADGIGQVLGPNTVALMGHSPPFKDLVAGIVERYPDVLWVDPWPASNHSTFASHGVPAMALGSAGVADVFHQPVDTARWVSPERLGQAVSLVADVVRGLQDRSAAWCRPTT